MPSRHFKFTTNSVGMIVDWVVDNCINIAHLRIHVALLRPVWILPFILPFDSVELVLQTGVHFGRARSSVCT